jgi:Putative Flp pilus-assembly TadE/G-like
VRRRPQSGQAIVLAAVAMIALAAMTGLVLASGSAYWERRHLQELADGAALAAANKMIGGCAKAGSQPVTTADSIIDAQLGAGSGLSTSGSCSTAYVGGNTYNDPLMGGAVISTITYPYGGSELQVEVKLTGTIPLQLGALLGASNATIAARAVARFNAASLPGSFAVYSAQGINCNGGSGGSISVKGSLYSGGAIDSSCSIYAQAIKSGTGYTDYGDILVYPAGQGWSQGGGSCAPGSVTGNAICSDGIEISGNLASNVACAPPSPTWRGLTDYLDIGQGTATVNPNPCPQPPVVPAPNLLGFVPPEPNLDVNAQKTISPLSPAPCPAGRPQNSSSLGTPDYTPSQVIYLQGRSFSLSAATGTASVSSLSISGLLDALTKSTGSGTPGPNDVLYFTLTDPTAQHTQSNITLRQSASAGDTTLAVNSFTPNYNYPSGTMVIATYALPVGRVAPGAVSAIAQPAPPDANGLYHFHAGCYGWLDISRVHAFYTPPGGSSPIPGAVLDPGFFFFNGASESGDPVSSGAGGLCLNGGTPGTAPGKLFGTDVTLEFVNGTSFSTADCSPLPTNGTSVPGFGSSSQPFSAPGSASSWCPYIAPTSSNPNPREPGCQGLLVWAPPYQYQPPAGGQALCQNQGTFYVKGTTSEDVLGGTIYWPGQPQQSTYNPCTPPPTSSSAMNSPGCQYTANSTSQIVGQLICYSINVQGGAGGASLGITMEGNDNNTAPSEAGLIE